MADETQRVYALVRSSEQARGDLLAALTQLRGVREGA
jgi:hypothetical protein